MLSLSLSSFLDFFLVIYCLYSYCFNCSIAHKILGVALSLHLIFRFIFCLSSLLFSDAVSIHTPIRLCVSSHYFIYNNNNNKLLFIKFNSFCLLFLSVNVLACVCECVVCRVSCVFLVTLSPVSIHKLANALLI